MLDPYLIFTKLINHLYLNICLQISTLRVMIIVRTIVAPLSLVALSGRGAVLAGDQGVLGGGAAAAASGMRGEVGEDGSWWVRRGRWDGGGDGVGGC